ncbi:hypothetical protein HOY80DRAFT_888940 [Tuber brumale]|nr:hypothetical protein HOY80DRAFT_888940 [Tuber brumale]
MERGGEHPISPTKATSSNKYPFIRCFLACFPFAIRPLTVGPEAPPASTSQGGDSSTGASTEDKAIGGETKPGKEGSRQDSGQWPGRPEAQWHRGEVTV